MKPTRERLLDEIEALGYDAYDSARAVVGSGDWAEAFALIEKEAVEAARPRGVITIRYQEPEGIPWTTRSNLVPGSPYTYATDGLMVTVDWE